MSWRERMEDFVLGEEDSAVAALVAGQRIWESGNLSIQLMPDETLIPADLEYCEGKLLWRGRGGTQPIHSTARWIHKQNEMPSFASDTGLPQFCDCSCNLLSSFDTLTKIQIHSLSFQKLPTDRQHCWMLLCHWGKWCGSRLCAWMWWIWLAWVKTLIGLVTLLAFRPHLTSQDTHRRCRATSLLSRLVSGLSKESLGEKEGRSNKQNIQSLSQNIWTINFEWHSYVSVKDLVAFFCDRLKDHHSVTPHVLQGLSALVCGSCL